MGTGNSVLAPGAAGAVTTSVRLTRERELYTAHAQSGGMRITASVVAVWFVPIAVYSGGWAMRWERFLCRLSGTTCEGAKGEPRHSGRVIWGHRRNRRWRPPTR